MSLKAHSHGAIETAIKVILVANTLIDIPTTSFKKKRLHYMNIRQQSVCAAHSHGAIAITVADPGGQPATTPMDQNFLNFTGIFGNYRKYIKYRGSVPPTWSWSLFQ